MLRWLPPRLVLAYHSVAPDWRHPLSVSPETFRRHLRQLDARGYTGVRFSEAAFARNGPVVAVTFDDAFASIVPWAEQALEELSWPATVFVPTEVVDAGTRLVWLAPPNPGPEFAALSWTEIERLATKGWEIGSHTLTHPRLSVLNNAELERELSESRAVILKHVPTCTAVSYPWGEVDDRVVDAARHAGYETGSGLVGRFATSDPMRVPRFAVSASDGAVRYGFKTSTVGWRVRGTRIWPALERARCTALRLRNEEVVALSLSSLRRMGAAVLFAKLRHRLWSTRCALAVFCEPAGERHRVRADVHIDVALEAPQTFTELPALLDRSRGFEYLFLRGTERTRRAEAGELVVARDREGQVAAFHFVHLEQHRLALQKVARGLYPPLEPDEALTEGVYCLPRHRGERVVAAMLNETLDRLAERGIARAYAYIDVRNRSSLRAFHRAGFRPRDTMRVDRYRLGRLRSTFALTSAEVLQQWSSAGT